MVMMLFISERGHVLGSTLKTASFCLWVLLF